jgi:hypothetical protein
VKRHLKDVDNVPLLVSLFTDVTRKSTCEMVIAVHNLFLHWSVPFCFLIMRFFNR